MSACFIDGEYVVIVVFIGDQVNNERLMADASQHGGGENGSVEAMTLAILQDTQRTPIPHLFTVLHAVQKFLDSGGRSKGCDTPRVASRHQVVENIKGGISFVPLAQ